MGLPVTNPINIGDLLTTEALSQKQKEIKTHNEEKLDLLKFGVPSVIIGAADTILQSLTPDSLIDEDTVKDFVSNLAQPLGEFYRENEAGSKTIGEIVSSFVPIFGAVKLVRTGQFVDKLLGKLKHGDLLRKFAVSSGRTRADRSKQVEQNAKLFVKNKQLGINDTLTPAFSKAIRQQSFEAATDVLKEGIAANAAIGLFFNESDMFFPDFLSWQANAALFAIPDAVFAAGAFAFTRRAINKHIQSAFATGWAKELNPHDLPITDLLSRPGQRGDKAAVAAISANIAAKDAAEGANEALRSSGAARVNGERSELKEELVNMAQDDVYGHGISHKTGLGKDSGELKNAAQQVENDPTLIVTATSIEKLAPETQVQLAKNINKRLKQLDSEIATVQIGLNKDVAAPLEEKIVTIQMMDSLRAERTRVANIHAIVLETDGTITPSAQRRWSVLDDQESVQITKRKEVGDAFFELSVSEANKIGMEIGTTATGKIQLVGVKDTKTILGDVNTTRALTDKEIIQESEQGMLLNLRDISQDWHFQNGTRGRAVFESLSPELQQEIKNWTGSSGSSKLREWVKNDDPRAAELIQAYRKAGLQRRLHELQSENGTIPLYRGEQKAETKAPTNDVVSMSTDPAFAKRAFGSSIADNVIRRDVPVDDVIMVVGGIGKHDEFEIIVKGNTRRNKSAVGIEAKVALNSQTFAQRMHAWVLQQKALDAYNPKVNDTIFVHPGSSFMELDFAIEVAKKFRHEFPDVVQFASGGSSSIANIEAMQFASLTQKFREYQKVRMIKQASTTGVLKLTEAQKLSNFDEGKMLNLPADTAGGRHPLMEVFDELIPTVGGEIRDLRSFVRDMPELKAAMVKHVDAGRLGETLHADLKLHGNSLRFDRNSEHKPSVLLSTSNYSGRIGAEQLSERILANKLVQNQMLTQARQNNAPVVAAIVEEIFSRPDAVALATRPDLIIEGTQAGVGIITTQQFALRNNPILETLDRVMDLANKRALEEMKIIIKGAQDKHTKVFNKLRTNNNAASLSVLNIAINSLRQGWHLEREAVSLGEGRWGFALIDNPQNRKRYKEIFDIDWEDIAPNQGDVVMMPVRASKSDGNLPVPVALDDLGLEGLRSVTQISHAFLDNLNYLRGVRKLAPINKKEWHVPAIDITKGINLYLVDGSGKVQRVVNGATFGEAMKKARKDVASEENSLAIIDQESIMQYHDSLGDIWANPRNFASAEFQTGGAKGKTVGATIEQGHAPLDNIINSLQANFQLLTRHTSATIFESELNFTKAFIKSSTLQARQRGTQKVVSTSKAQKTLQPSLHQTYERVVLQKTALNENGYVGKFFYAVEGTADDIIRATWDKVHALKPISVSTGEKEFKQIAEIAGEYNPFKNAVDLLEKTQHVNVPPTFRGGVTGFNKFATDMILRVLDFGMPVINFASLVAVTPAVTHALRRGKDETIPDWLARTGAVGAPIDDSFILPNTTRMVMDGMSFAFSKEATEIRKLALERGYIQQFVAEQLNLWASPKRGWVGRNREAIINKLSFATDKSEMWSRDIAFMMNYRIGKKVFQLEDEPAMLFAHVQANQIIGDFRPTNRPQMFQGATGMPFGLFTTWAVNWLQRVFGDIEAGRAGAVFWQASVQNFLFGAESLPGVTSFIDTFLTSYDGTTNINDSMDAQFGTTATDAFMQGTLSSLTGVAVQSRADITAPNIFKGEGISQAIPAVGVMRTLMQGVGEAFSSVRQNGGFDSREMSEIIATYGVNGAVKNLFEVMNGQSVNRHGETINADVRTFESIIPRLVELKSVREERMARELQRDRVQQHIQQEHIFRLSKQMRSAIRGNSVDNELIESAMGDFIKAGGNPSGFTRYIRQQLMMSQFDKSSRMILKAVRASDEQGKMGRLMKHIMPDGDE